MTRQRRYRKFDPDHLARVRMLPCLVPCCGDDTSTEAAHIRMGDARLGKRKVGMGEKPDDIYCVPLCGKHHREQHMCGEHAWWLSKGIDPIPIAQALWIHTDDYDTCCEIIRVNAASLPLSTTIGDAAAGGPEAVPMVSGPFPAE